MDVLLVSGLNDNQQTKTKDLILDQLSCSNKFSCLYLEHCRNHCMYSITNACDGYNTMQLFMYIIICT